jgi:hypothetical protein
MEDNMSMSTCVKAFRPPDEKFKGMLSVYNQCTKLGISIPDEVNAFFNREVPDPTGVEIDLKKVEGCLKYYRANSREGIEVDIAKLPKDITILRFVNSW